jgi:hypothetical protein
MAILDLPLNFRPLRRLVRPGQAASVPKAPRDRSSSGIHRRQFGYRRAHNPAGDEVRCQRAHLNSVYPERFATISAVERIDLYLMLLRYHRDRISREFLDLTDRVSASLLALNDPVSSVVRRVVVLESPMSLENLAGARIHAANCQSVLHIGNASGKRTSSTEPKGRQLDEATVPEVVSDNFGPSQIHRRSMRLW